MRRNSELYLHLYELRLKHLIDSARQAKIEPVFITHPLLVGPASDDVTKLDLANIKVSRNRNGAMWWDLLELHNDVTRRVGRENSVLVIDLARQMPKSSRYFYDFVHFTNEGAQVAADIIYSSLCPMLATKHAQYAQYACAN